MNNEELLKITDTILQKNTDDIPLTEEELKIANKYFSPTKIKAMRMSKSVNDTHYCSVVRNTKKFSY